MGSFRRECLDHVLIHDDTHLERVTTEYTMSYFNQERPHQGIEQRIPDQYDLTRSKPTSGRITSKTILGGLHHSYSRAIYLNWRASFYIKALTNKGEYYLSMIRIWNRHVFCCLWSVRFPKNDHPNDPNVYSWNKPNPPWREKELSPEEILAKTPKNLTDERSSQHKWCFIIRAQYTSCGCKNKEGENIGRLPVLVCAGYLVHPPRFVRLNNNFKSIMIPIRVSDASYRSRNTKNRPSKVCFLSSLTQKVTSCGPDGDRNREA